MIGTVQSKIKQQRLTNRQPRAQTHTVGKLIYKHLVDGCEIVVKPAQIKDGIIRDGVQFAEVFLAESDRPLTSIFNSHRQTMGSADHEPRSIHEAGTVFKKRTGTKAVCLSGFPSYVTHQFPGQFFQGDGKRNGFDGKNRKVNTAAVAGTPFITGYLPGIPFLNPAADSINLIN
jgi:hypothetical protein